VFCDAEVVNSDLTSRNYSVWQICNFTPDRQARYPRGGAFADLLDCHTIQGAALAFRTELRPLLIPFSRRWPYDAWIAIVLAACTEIVPLGQRLMQYRQHGSNYLGMPQAMPQARSWWRVHYDTMVERYHKFRDLPGYYRRREDFAEDQLQQLDELRAWIAAHGGDERFAQHLVTVDRRAAKLRSMRDRARGKLARLGGLKLAPKA
jgi:hypothetical protein